MKPDDLPPLDEETRRLFAAEGRFAEEPAERRARVWQQVERAVATLPPGGGGGDGSGGGAAGAGSATDAAGGLGKLAAITAAAFALGGVSGAAIYGATVDPPAPVVIERPAPTPAPLALPPPVELPPTDAAVPAPIPAERVSRSASRAADAPAPPAPVRLAQERALIDVVRTGIARGHADAALEAIARHERDFPDGRLVEEREGLRAIALARAGRETDARRAAERFEMRYPNSLLLPAVRAALARER